MTVFFSEFLFFSSLVGILTVLAGYPFMIWLCSLGRPSHNPPCVSSPFSVSIIVVVHNGADLIDFKYQNSLSLDYPPDQLELIFYSDGSNDGTSDQLNRLAPPGVRVLESRRHEGKHMGINRAAAAAKGDILIFSDIDALLVPGALAKITRHFTDRSIGGVCGQKTVGETGKPLSGAQQLYIHLDSKLKQRESLIGSITSNDGKLYAIRKTLFRPVPPAVTDDLYAALNVVLQKKRFIFEPLAVARVKLPARDGRHEVERRRRIVSRSLNGIFKIRGILNPKIHGLFSVRLLINKVFRRYLPVFFMGLFFSSLVLVGEGLFYALSFWGQVVFYLFAAVFPLIQGKRGSVPVKIASAAFYFCAGMCGTFLGLIDFTLKNQPKKWTPVKKDFNLP